MIKIYKLSFTIFIALTFSLTLSAQNNFFTDAGQNRTLSVTGHRAIIPQQYRASSLDLTGLKNFLWSLPGERSFLYNRNQAPVIQLPMPDGQTARFQIWESSIQEPGLQAKFPDIKTFAGQGLDDRYATIRMDLGPNGFHAQVLTVNGTYYIDPYARGNTTDYITYYRTDLKSSGTFLCEVPDNPRMNQTEAIEAACLGTDMRTYRLAVACTGEYAQAPGINAGSNPAILHAAIVTTVNRVVGVYEKELSIRMVLIANNNLIEFLDPASDPFNGNNSSGVLINESQVVIDANIGLANYDIGHTFSTGGGGLAQLNSPCGNSKARGITGRGNPTGDAYDIDYVAHEMGHQFGGNHSMAGCGTSPNNTKYEVGSGSTIQAYAGICPGEDLQPNSDPFFHAISFDEISNFVVTGNGSTCGTIAPTGNTLPVIDALPNGGVSIPPSTPFTLTGSATDANGDALTYNWEQWDFSGTATWNAGATAPANNTVPLFRSRRPKTTGSRTFPDMSVILANYPANPPAAMNGLKGETLSPVARVMKFKLTVRDNRAGGGGVTSSGAGGCQNNSIFQVNVVPSAPFVVTAPNGGESYPGGSMQTITWNVGNTNVAPIGVSNVRITLSTDGGLTYPTEVIASTPNDGTESLPIPAIVSTTARIRIEAIGNIFFDISNANFTITLPVNAFDFASPAAATAACPAPATMDITLGTTTTGTFTTPINLVASGNPAGTTVSFSVNPLTPGSSTVVTLNGANTLAAGSYPVTITGTAGSLVRTRIITYTVNAGAGPAITAQPAPQVICNGGDATFSITSATATTFQWQVNTGSGFVNISNGGVYSGATTNTLSITGANATMSTYQYRAIAGVQCGSTTSNAGLLTVNTAPSITTQPQTTTLCAGTNVTFTVAANGSPTLTYQWQVSTDGGGIYNNVTNGGVYSGATTSSLTITGITAALNTYRYRAVVTGVCAPVATSNAAILNVVTAVAITTQPVNAVVCAGSNASFTVAGSGTGIIYQWQVNTGSGYVDVPVSALYTGSQTATLTIVAAPASISGYTFRALLSNATCPSPGTSNPATLTVNTLPAIATNPANAIICLGGTTSFTSAATGTGVTYQWQVNPGSGFVNIANGGVYSGATTTTLTITGATAAMNTYQYRLVASGTCPPAANSTAATLTVINPVVITAQPPVAQEVCSGSNTSFSVTATSTETITYQWQVNTGAGFVNVTNAAPYSGANSATLTITNAPASLNGAIYRVLVSNNTCTTPVTSGSLNLTVRQLPVITLTASATSLLPGQTSVLTAVPVTGAGSPAPVITWTYNGGPLVNNNLTYTANIQQVGTYIAGISQSWPSGIVCSSASLPVVITAGVSERLFIFPSPNDGQFTVSYINSGGNSTKRRITVYNSAGAKVYDARFDIAGTYTLIPVNIKPSASGIYHVVVGDASNKKLATGSIVVQQ